MKEGENHSVKNEPSESHQTETWVRFIIKTITLNRKVNKDYPNKSQHAACGGI